MNTESYFYPQEETIETGFTQVELFQRGVEKNQPEVESKSDDDSSFIFHPKVRKPSTHIPIIKAIDSGRYNSLSYENWEGEIVAIENRIIRAKLVCSTPRYYPRIVEMERGFFEQHGILKTLEIGDEFELSFKKIQKPKGQIENLINLRMIEIAKIADDVVEAALEEDLRELSFLFDNHERNRE